MPPSRDRLVANTFNFGPSKRGIVATPSVGPSKGVVVDLEGEGVAKVTFHSTGESKGPCPTMTMSTEELSNLIEKVRSK